MELIMERYGFIPEDTFSQEQIEKMRSMVPEGNVVARKGLRVGVLVDRATSVPRQGKPGTHKIKSSS